VRKVLGLKRAPEFEAWLEKIGIANAQGEIENSTNERQMLLPHAAQILGEA